MKASFRNHPVVQSTLYLLCWTVFALVTGAAGGLIGGLFGCAIKAVTGLRGSCPWILYLLPLIGQKMTAFDMREEAIVSAMADMLLSRLKDPSLPPRCKKVKAQLKTIHR